MNVHSIEIGSTAMAALQMNNIISEVIIDQQREAAVIECVGALCEDRCDIFSMCLPFFSMTALH